MEATGMTAALIVKLYQDLGCVTCLAHLADLFVEDLDADDFKYLGPRLKRLIKTWIKKQQQLRKQSLQPVAADKHVGSNEKKGKYDPKFGSGPRVALCIGIDDYPGSNRLPNCVFDAEDMHDCCKKKMRFDEVIVLKNSNKREMRQAIRDLREKFVKDGSLVIIFFSGHGAEYEGVNYLLPLGMDSNAEEDYAEEAVSVDLIMQTLHKFTSVVIVILLDCCRENDHNTTFKGAKSPGDGGTKGLCKNFRSSNKNAEFFVGLACDPGTVALPDEEERNSKYTSALLQHLPVPGRTLEESMKEVAKEVFEKTRRKQRPWNESCVMQAVLLVPN